MDRSSACVAALLAVLAFSSARAQDPAPEPEKPTQAEIDQYETMLAEGATSNPAALEKVVRYHIHAFTLPGTLESLPKHRRTIRTDLQTAGKAPQQQVHAAINKMLLEGLYPLAIGQLPAGEHLTSPVARAAVQVNAMLMLGELNQREPTSQVAPLPLPEALPKLLAAAALPELSDAAKNPALQGIRRHAELGIADADQKIEVQKAMLDLLAMKSPPPTRDAEVHLWFRQIAAETLGALGACGFKPESAEVVQALLAVISDEDQPLAIRCSSAEALGNLDLKTPPELNLSLAAHAVARLGVDVLETKADNMARFKGQFVKVGAAVSGGGEGRGIAAAANETHKPFLDGLLQQWTPVKQAVDKLDNTTTAVPQDLRDKAQTLSQWLDQNAPASQELIAAAKPPAPAS